LLELIARRNHPRIATPVPAPRKPWPLAIRIIGQVLVSSLLLSGLATTVLEFVALVLALTLIVIARLAVVPRLRRWVSVIGRIPILLRLLVCLAVGFVLAQAVVVPAARSGEQSFASMLGVILASLVLAAFLLPGPSPSTAEPAPTPTRVDPQPHTPP
jgi:hypothetical protein